ncbi:DNA-binding response regulator [Alicyclobacillus acidoterrestris]|uniref:response regulator transcription factor n=1 Tax=Alicyclobacillus suci TaxID=2816080 RepID=UPI0011970F62|nr:DNA-binding response regulator [Alicyclobacillus acidoterrestris]
MVVLLVEDEPGFAEFLALELELQESVVHMALDGKTALDFVQNNTYDLVLLDINLPDISGLEVCRALRATMTVPIIMLTARGDVADRVEGLDAGADDYLVKPFAIEELFARIRATMRRQAAGSMANPQIHFGQVTVQLDTHRVTYQSQEVELTAREYDLLLYLLRHPNVTWSRQTLLERVWGFHAAVDTNVVDVYIGYLRQKVDPHKAFIKTVRGQGYRFEVSL